MALLNTKIIKYFLSHAFKNPKEHPPDKSRIKTKINMDNW